MPPGITRCTLNILPDRAAYFVGCTDLFDTTAQCDHPFLFFFHKYPHVINLP